MVFLKIPVFWRRLAWNWIFGAGVHRPGMNSISLFVFLFVAAAFLVTAVFADQAPAAPRAPRNFQGAPHPGGAKVSSQPRMDRAAATALRFGLDEKQTARVKEVYAAEQAAVRSLGRPGGAEWAAKVKQVRAESDAEVRRILTPGQQVKWDAAQKQREEMMAKSRAAAGHRAQSGQGPAPAPK